MDSLDNPKPINRTSQWVQKKKGYEKVYEKFLAACLPPRGDRVIATRQAIRRQEGKFSLIGQFDISLLNLLSFSHWSQVEFIDFFYKGDPNK